ncbi:MAG: 3-phosphoshikimate 1-carboxyvinyltransferase, partial [Spirochaetales bacterium]
MTETVYPATLSGRTQAPASKSHTIRAILIASLADGVSRIDHPLNSEDAASCVATCRALGADIEESDRDCLIVTGTGGRPTAPSDPVDVGNSGTTLFLAMGTAALAPGTTVFTGDEQIRRRSARNLLDALGELGASAWSHNSDGCAPLSVGGGIAGGNISLESPTSQYLSSLLLACPLAEGDSDIRLSLLWERPYVDMTLWWLDRQGIAYEREDYERFRISGKQSYKAFRTDVPGDYSSATFLLVGAAITGGSVILEEMHPDDPQGDRAVLEMLSSLGCEVTWPRPRTVKLSGPGYGKLSGGTLDLNATPDALPALAVLGAACNSPLHLTNVPQARAKETDRIDVMARELATLGISVDEAEDGMTIHPGAIKGGSVHGHGDHRVVMALAVAGLASRDGVSVDTAERAAVTYPGFFEALRGLAGR